MRELTDMLIHARSFVFVVLIILGIIAVIGGIYYFLFYSTIIRNIKKIEMPDVDIQSKLHTKYEKIKPNIYIGKEILDEDNITLETNKQIDPYRRVFLFDMYTNNNIILIAPYNIQDKSASYSMNRLVHYINVYNLPISRIVLNYNLKLVAREYIYKSDPTKTELYYIEGTKEDVQNKS